MLHADAVALLKKHGAEIEEGGDLDWTATLNEHTLKWRMSWDEPPKVKWLTQYLPAGKYGCTMPLGWENDQITSEERVKGFIEDACEKHWLTKTVYLAFGPDATHPDLAPSLRACPRGWKDKLCRVFLINAIIRGKELVMGKIKPEAVANWLQRQGHLTGTAD